jgi:hypothetical protein
MSDVRYGSLKVVTKCSFCDSPVIINGPVLKLKCKFCDKELLFSKNLWNEIIYKLDEFIYDSKSGAKNTLTSGSGKFEFKVTYSNDVPKCVKCKTELNVEGVYGDSIKCEDCGELNSICKSPEWIDYSSAKMIIGGVKEGVDSKTDLDKSLQPIAMNCPNCSSPLKITQEKTRVTTCEYCESEFYIPEPVWDKLHPKKTVTTWSIKFEGKGQCIIDREKHVIITKKKRELYKKNEPIREKNRVIGERYRKIKKEKEHLQEYLEGAEYYVSLLMVCIFGPIPILLSFMYITPLMNLLGNSICSGEFVTITEPVKGKEDSGETEENHYCKVDGKLKPIETKFIVVAFTGSVFFFIILGLLWRRQTKKEVANLKIELDEISESYLPYYKK